jgi:hypothetical protein
MRLLADGKRAVPTTFLQGGLTDVREKSHCERLGLLSELAWTKNLPPNQQMAVRERQIKHDWPDKRSGDSLRTKVANRLSMKWQTPPPRP